MRRNGAVLTLLIRRLAMVPPTNSMRQINRANGSWLEAYGRKLNAGCMEAGNQVTLQD